MSSIAPIFSFQTANSYDTDRTPQFIQGLVNIDNPLQRVEYLVSFPVGSLSQDELIELNYLILREKCFHNKLNDLASDQARLMQHPYSPLAVAYKQLGTICYENFLLCRNYEFENHTYNMMIRQIDEALELFKSRSVGNNAAMRCLTAASSLRSTIEMHRDCPLISLVWRIVEKFLIDFNHQNDLREVVVDIELTIDNVSELPSSQEIRQSIKTGVCIPPQDFSDERIAQLWSMIMAENSQATELYFTFHGTIQTRSSCFDAIEAATVHIQYE